MSAFDGHLPQGRPMPLAEAAECCGCSPEGTSPDRPHHVCANCPLLIERRENPDVMRAARAM